jgi:hypothetical protein
MGIKNNQNYMKKKNKQHVTDTIKEMKDDPKQALKEDYEQTKADMKNMKEAMVGDKEDK